MKIALLIVWVIRLRKILAQDEDLTCSNSYCTEYLEDNTCTSLPENCNIQNSTHNGLVLPFPGPCNCCDYCLENLNEGASCAVGEPSSPTPTSICGNGLACDATTLTCQRINSTCMQAQEDFDRRREAGTLGHLEVRVECDRNGLYQPYVCIPGEICYCVSEDGERIFGEIEYSQNAASILNCQCSRAYDTATELLGIELQPDQHFHCLSNGDYDELQCIGDSCYCVDSYDGSATSSSMSPVNVSYVSEKSIDCFNEDIHTEGEYFRDCELIYLRHRNLIQQYENEGYEVIGSAFPNCQLDGQYGPVQQNSSSKFCTYPNGTVIESFIVNIDDDLASSMNCKCARARSIMTTDEKPACCQNGNYASIQCRRGLCRCVDSNGNQVVQEVQESLQHTLSCYDMTCTL